MDETATDPREVVAARRPHAGVAVVFSVNEPQLVWKGLAGGRLVLGRSPEPGFSADNRLSREHAEIAFDGRRWTVRDLESRNGTFVDGARVQGSVTLDAAPRVVRLGQTLLLLMPDGWSVIGALHMRDGDRVIGPRLRATLSEIERAAAAGMNLLVTGESGSGKELAAATFHRAGPRAQGRMVAVNCAAVPSGLAERLLFGAVRGAYSGADKDVEGYIESAGGGVLFLDELGELDLDVQAKLLRVLETREVLPLGASRPRKVDVLFCFATHRDLRGAVAAGKFRADLLYRLSQPEVALPPLRERLEEVPWLITGELARTEPQVTADATFVEACMLRPWPGNVRELIGETRRAAHALLATPARTLAAEHLSPRAGTSLMAAPAAGPAPSAAPPAQPQAKKPPVTREQLAQALREAPDATSAARTLGVHRSHLYRLMKQFGIDRKDDGGGEDEEA